MEEEALSVILKRDQQICFLPYQCTVFLTAVELHSSAGSCTVAQFWWQSGEAIRWRVRYHWDLPRLTLRSHIFWERGGNSYTVLLAGCWCTDTQTAGSSFQPTLICCCFTLLEKGRMMEGWSLIHKILYSCSIKICFGLKLRRHSSRKTLEIFSIRENRNYIKLGKTFFFVSLRVCKLPRTRLNI